MRQWGRRGGGLIWSMNLCSDLKKIDIFIIFTIKKVYLIWQDLEKGGGGYYKYEGY